MNFKSMLKDELVDLSIRRFLFSDVVPPVNSDELDELKQSVANNNTKDNLVELLESNNTRGFEVVPDEHRQHPQLPIMKPKHGSQESIAYDLYLPTSINSHKPSDMVATDICAYMQSGEGLFGTVRSSAGIKKGLALSNSMAVIEKDYYNADNGGNIQIALTSITGKRTVSHIGGNVDDARIVQVWFAPFLKADNYDTKTKRTGGIGSSDKGDE